MVMPSVSIEKSFQKIFPLNTEVGRVGWIGPFVPIGRYPFSFVFSGYDIWVFWMLVSFVPEDLKILRGSMGIVGKCFLPHVSKCRFPPSFLFR